MFVDYILVINFTNFFTFYKNIIFYIISYLLAKKIIYLKYNFINFKIKKYNVF